MALTDGQEVGYDVRERGDVPVVQLHGLTSSRARDVILELDFTAEMDGVRALRYDAPGHGQSGVPSIPDAKPEDFLWGRMADVLLTMLDEVFPASSSTDATSSPSSATVSPASSPSSSSPDATSSPATTDSASAGSASSGVVAAPPVSTDSKSAGSASSGVVAAPPVIGIGQSMGTATLLCAALKNPDRFSGLILAIPPTIWEARQAQTYQYRRFADLVEQHGMDLFREAANSSPLPPAVNPNRPETDPDVAVELLPTLYRGAGMTDLPDPSEFENLDLPVLILAWIEDGSHPMWSAEALLEVLPNATMEVAETPDDVAAWPARMKKFIDEHGIPAS